MHPTLNARHRIVITGMGLVSPLGCGVEVAWSRLLSGQSGLRRLPDELTADIPAQVAGVVPSVADDPLAGFDMDRVATPKEQRKIDRFIAFALAAAHEALGQAQWAPTTPATRQRTATVIASGIGGFPALADAVRTTGTRGPRRLSPFTIPSFLVNLAAGHVSIRHGLQGPIGAPATACAASIQAIGDAARMIRCGEADIAVCGGAEAAIDRVSLGAFAAAKSLSTGFNDTPQRASRPFDRARDGFVMGEGAGLLVIESLAHAVDRGAVPLAELVGYGTSADAHHITSGPEDGRGALQAMQAALTQAHLAPAAIQHLQAHATSTPVGDECELAALRQLFGAQGSVAITSTKSATGHLLGAAGGVGAIFAVQALRGQVVPATLNLDDLDPLADGLDIVRGGARTMAITHAMVNGFGFGGVNACAIFKRWQA